jgi:hypothetical protein
VRNRPKTTRAELPDPDKLVAFDRNRHVMMTMAENIEKASRPQLAELVQLLVERVQTSGRTVEPASIEWTPPARPFFEPAALLWRPRTDSDTQQERSVLDWYLEAIVLATSCGWTLLGTPAVDPDTRGSN